jgi:hypothetical protein
MKIMIVLSGVMALAVAIGHVVVSSKSLSSRLKEDSDTGEANASKCMFHYVSVFLVISAIALLMMGFEVRKGSPAQLLTRFIALNYAALAVVQFLFAKSSTSTVIQLFTEQSKLPGAAKKIFQWLIFAAIAVLAWVGASPEELFDF